MFGTLIFVVLCLACVVRLNAHPDAVMADMRHPVRHAFMAGLPISLILIANIGVQLFDHTTRTIDTGLTFIWCVGAVLEVAATLWVVAKWLNPPDQGGIQWTTFTPIFFIPVVGNVLTPLAGVPLGLEAWAMAQFGVGALLWLVLLVLFFVRLAQVGPLPGRLAPSLFITIVPHRSSVRCCCNCMPPRPWFGFFGASRHFSWHSRQPSFKPSVNNPSAWPIGA
jgi:tellurite resistance protein